MKKRSHIIQQQFIEVSFAGLEDGVGMHDRIAEIFYTKLQPKMNALFDEVADGKYLLSVEKLDIDCGFLPEKDWEEDLVINTLNKLKAELLTKHRKILAANEGAGNEAEQAFLYFLQRGHLPWNIQADSLTEVEASIKINSSFIKVLQELMRGQQRIVARLLQNVSNALKDQIMEAFFKQDGERWKMIQSLYAQAGDVEKLNLQKIVFEQSGSAPPAKPGNFSSSDEQRSANAPKKNMENNADQEQKVVKEPPDESIYINNAGLVLLHPFLPQLFETTGLYKANEWAEASAREIAVKALDYLSRGKNKFEELNFSFNKILCGLHPADLADDNVALSGEIMLACDELLKEAIGYWKQLKNTGIDAFRESFLQRSGKLSTVDNGWLLQVEQHATDILLDSLPWGIGTIRLPWMDELLYTEWR